MSPPKKVQQIFLIYAFWHVSQLAAPGLGDRRPRDLKYPGVYPRPMVGMPPILELAIRPTFALPRTRSIQ